MKIWLIPTEGPRRALESCGDYALSLSACPKCAATPLRVGGTGRRIASDDRAYEADGVCLDCRERVGVIRAEVDTLFGVREDEAVSARCRVY